MKPFSKLLILCFFSYLILQSAEAKRFNNQYCEFELPSGWICALEGSEWVCQSENDDRKKEAIIILAAKTRGEQDSLEEYEIYLKKPKTFTLPGGKMQVSEPKSALKKEVNGHQWIDSLHLASEVPGFYTRYLATVKEDLGVAVTLSVAKDHYQEYQAVYDAVVASLRVFRQKKDVGTGYQIAAKGDDDFADTTFAPDEQIVNVDPNAGQKKGKAGAGDDNTLYLLLGAVAVIGFVILKKKKG
jgi:hypothetical protein